MPTNRHICCSRNRATNHRKAQLAGDCPRRAAGGAFDFNLKVSFSLRRITFSASVIFKGDIRRTASSVRAFASWRISVFCGSSNASAGFFLALRIYCRSLLHSKAPRLFAVYHAANKRGAVDCLRGDRVSRYTLIFLISVWVFAISSASSYVIGSCRRIVNRIVHASSEWQMLFSSILPLCRAISS